MSDLSSVGPGRDYQNQLEDVKAEQERKLSQVRADYRKREDDTHQSGQAAISHIKRSNEERIDQLRREGESGVRKEAEQTNRDYSELRRKAALQAEALEGKTVREQEAARRNVHVAKTEEARAIEQSQSKIKDFLETQRENQARAQVESNKEVDQTRRRGNEQVTQTKAKVSGELAKVETKHKETLSQIGERNKEIYDESKYEADQRLKNLRSQSDTKLERERTLSNRQFQELQKKSHEAMTTQQRESEQRLSQQQKTNQEKFSSDRDRSLTLNEEVQSEYARETQRVQVAGESEIATRESRFKELAQKQEAQNRLGLKGIEANYTEKSAETRQQGEARIQNEVVKLDETLVRQQDQFKERYAANDKAHKSALDAQKENFLQEMYKGKTRIDARAELASNRASDPFYKLHSFDATLYEREGSYIVRGKVAPHEKDTVDIVVKDNKIVLSAKRAFEENFVDPDGDRSSTNSYQTYRQEFKLEQNVEPNKAIRRIEADGTVLVIAPKKGYLAKG